MIKANPPIWGNLILAHAHNKFNFKSESYTTSDVLVITVQECEHIIYTFTLYDFKVTLYDVTLKVSVKGTVKVTVKGTVTVKVTVKGTVTVKVTVKGTVTVKVTVKGKNLYVPMFKNVLNNYRDKKSPLNN